MDLILPTDHLSITQMSMYLRCPMQYYFRYVEGRKIPPKWTMFLGSCGHGVLEYNNRQKIESFKDIKTDEALEYYHSEFTKKKDETEIDWQDEQPGKVKDRGAGVLKTYFEGKYNEPIQPIAVEEKIEIEFEETNFPLLMFVDVITKDEIGDYKFASKRPSEANLQKDIQLTGYGLGFYYKYNRLPASSFYQHLIYQKTKNDVVPTPVPRTEDDYIRFREDFKNVAANIADNYKKGTWVRNPHNYFCSPKNCGYWNLCRKERVIFDFIKPDTLGEVKFS